MLSPSALTRGQACAVLTPKRCSVTGPQPSPTALLKSLASPIPLALAGLGVPVLELVPQRDLSRAPDTFSDPGALRTRVSSLSLVS